MRAQPARQSQTISLVSIEQLILLAVIQGLTEFLPVSSSAHLILLPALTDLPDQGALIDVSVHLGSLGAVIVYFWRDVLGLFQGLGHLAKRRDSFEARLVLFLVIATIPTLAVGYGLYKSGATDALRSAEVIAWTTIAFGILLYAADYLGKTNRDLSTMTHGNAFLVGLAQVIALVPGTSRSGITITMSRMLGFERTEAARFSMLLAIPTIAAFGLYTAMELLQSGSTVMQRDGILAAGLAFISALLAIAIFMRLLQHMTLLPFLIYRLVLGFGLLAYIYL